MLSIPQALELASAHQGAGRLHEAEAVVREVLKAVPRHPQALHLLGIIAHQAGRIDVAIGFVRQAIEADGTVGLFHTNLCEMLRQSGQLEAAVDHGRRGAELNPRIATAHSNLGVAYYDQGDYDAAERCQREALALKPGMPQALNNLGSIARQRDDKEQAVHCYREALAAAPDHIEALNNLGALLTELDQTGEARQCLLRAVRLNPRYAEAHRNLGTLFLQEEAFDKARVAFNEALKFKPDFIDALVGLALIHREHDAFDEATALIDRALTIDPAHAAALTQRGNLYGDMGFPERALAAFDEAIASDPESEGALVAKGHVLIQLGDMTTAQTTLERALEVAPDSIAAQLAVVQLKKVRAEDAALAALEAENARLDESSVTRRIPVHFALGKCYDDIGEYDRAMPHFLEGCRLKRARIPYDADAQSRHIDDVINTFDAATVARLAGNGDASELPIFVLGMPRSGTTLTEQIIASHPLVYGAGELPDLLGIANRSPLTGARAAYPASLANITARELGALGAEYAAGLHARAPDAARITDKMPANFYCVGLIHLALPRARIVHVRRNAVDTCLSGITKLFKNGQYHSYDLAEQGRFYVNYARLMDHWRNALPPGAFYEVEYEALVADTEQEARALIDYCGLEWDDRCLEFHKTERSVRTASVTQVRQPIYKTSVERWRRYEQFLGPLLEALGDLAEQ